MEKQPMGAEIGGQPTALGQSERGSGSREAGRPGSAFLVLCFWLGLGATFLPLSLLHSWAGDWVQ